MLKCLFMAMTISGTPPALTTASFTSSFPATDLIALRICFTNSCKQKRTLIQFIKFTLCSLTFFVFYLCFKTVSKQCEH